MSLKSRFQGALIGVYLGLNISENEGLEEYLTLIFEVIKNIINEEKLSNKKDFITQIKEKNINELSLILLPVILFYHENLALLQTELETIFQELEIKEENREYILIWSKIISLICREKIKENNLRITKLTNLFLEKKSPVIKPLEIIETSLQQGKSLQETIRELNKITSQENRELIVAIYLFISTPEDFNLTLKRGKIIKNYQKNLILPLTAILSGLYNGHYAIEYQQLYSQKQAKISSEIMLLAEKLYFKWCGVYHMNKNYQNQLINVTSINIIKPRSWSKQNYEKF